MADVRGMLVVPAKGDPGGLLAEGVCNALPPLAVDMGGWWSAVGDVADRDWDDAEYALPLWWDGALVPEGWDRLRRVLARLGRASTYLGIESLSDVADVVRAAEYAVAAGVGSRVVLVDADGREVTS